MVGLACWFECNGVESQDTPVALNPFGTVIKRNMETDGTGTGAFIKNSRTLRRN